MIPGVRPEFAACCKKPIVEPTSAPISECVRFLFSHSWELRPESMAEAVLFGLEAELATAPLLAALQAGEIVATGQPARRSKADPVPPVERIPAAAWAVFPACARGERIPDAFFMGALPDDSGSGWCDIEISRAAVEALDERMHGAPPIEPRQDKPAKRGPGRPRGAGRDLEAERLAREALKRLEGGNEFSSIAAAARAIAPQHPDWTRDMPPERGRNIERRIADAMRRLRQNTTNSLS